MATDVGFTGLKGELPYAYYIRQEGDDVTTTFTAKEVADWLHEVALQLGKSKLAGEDSTYAKRLVEAVEDGCGTVDGVAGLVVGGLVDAGMRKGDAKTLMRNVSEKCMPPGGDHDDSSFDHSGLAWPRRACRWRSRTPLRRRDLVHTLLCKQSR